MSRFRFFQSPRSLTLTVVAVLALYAPFPSTGIQAAAGDLDLSFGSGGVVITDLGGTEDPRSVAVKADGKIVAAGSTFTNRASDFALAQYNPDGSLDSTFGSGGKVFTDFFGETDAVISVLAEPDGKVVAVGTAFKVNHYVFALARYKNDGSLDSTFGSNGKVTTELTGQEQPEAAVRDSFGRIIVVGNSIGNGPDDGFLVARYNHDGSLDMSFGSGGKVTIDILGRGGVFANAVALQQDGKIVMAGYAIDGNPNGFALVRFNHDGTLDSSYGSGGLVITSFNGLTDIAHAVAIQQNGKAVAAGLTSASPGIGHIALARYNSDGGLDTTFGSGGKIVNTGPGSDDAAAVAIQKDGKIVVVGTKFGLLVIRYNNNGTRDTTFGVNGMVDTVFVGGFGPSGRGMAIQPDRKIIAVGITADSNGNADFALARYDAGPVAFDMCLQDDGGFNLLQFSSITGEYQFTNCGGFTIGGTGVITTKGSTLTLQHNGTDRRLLARIDGGVNKGTASLQVFALGTTFTIADRNILNNTCACGGAH